MKDIELQGRLRRLGMNPRQAARVTRDIRDRIHPAAVVAAQVLVRGERTRGLGLNMQSTASTMQYVKTGAAIGSVVPVIGTVVGAVIGGAIAGLKHILGNKDVRTSAADRAAAASILAQYMAAANLAGPNGALGAALTLAQLQQIFFSVQAVYGAEYGEVDPRFFDVYWQICDGLAKQVAAAAVTLPPGSTFNIAAVSGRSATGKVYTFGPTTAQLPSIVNLQTLGALMTELMMRDCSEASMSAGDRAYQNKHDPGGLKCKAFWNRHPENVRVMADVIAYELQQRNPSVFVDPNAIGPPPATLGVPQITATPAVVQAATALAVQNAAAGVIPQITTQAGTPDAFPANYQPLPAQQTLSPVADASGALMQQQLADQGVNMTSPDAQALLQQVATQGVQETPAGPAKAGLSVLQMALLASVAGGFLLMKGKRHG